MTVLTEVSTVIYSGNGVTTAFDTTFPFVDAADLVVTKILIADATETVLTITTDYSVTGGEYDIGTVTLTAALATTYQLRIDRSTDVDQPTDFQPTGEFPIATLERQMDRIVFVQQETRRDMDQFSDQLDGLATEEYVDDAIEEIETAVTESAASAATATASAAAAAASLASILSGGLASSPVSAAMEPVLAAASLAAARTAMGVPGLTENQTWTGNNTFNTGTVTLSNGVTIAGTLAGAAATLSTTLAVTGAITGASTLVMTGLVTANAGLNVAGAPLNTPAEVTVASATTTNINTAASNKICISGTTTITGLTLGDGRFRLVRFSGALILPTGANITTVAGDTALFAGEASSVVRCMHYQRADGSALAAGGGGYTEVNSQAFDASGTWTRPTTGTWVWVLCVGAGGSGSRQSSTSAIADGGGGGESVMYVFKRTDLSATEAVTIGAGGAARSGSNQLGAPGGQTSLGTRLTAKGGAGGGTVGTGADTVAGTGATAVADPGLTLAIGAPIGALRPFVMPAGPIVSAQRTVAAIHADDDDRFQNVTEGETGDNVGSWPIRHPLLAWHIPRAASGARKLAGSGGVIAGETSVTLYSIGGSSSAYNTGSGTAGTGFGAGGGGGYTASGEGAGGYCRVITFS